MKNIYVSVTTEQQLKEAASIDEVFALFPAPFLVINGLCGAAKKRGKRIFAQLPEVLRENCADKAGRLLDEAKGLDGAVVKNIDELGLLKDGGFKGELIADPMIYAYNREAVSFYLELFPDMRFILSDELTDNEAKGLNINAPVYKAYGCPKLMTTAQKTGRVLDGEFENQRHDRFFQIYEPEFGYTVIYGKEPVYMQDRLNEVPFDDILIELTFENAVETRDIIKRTLSRAPAPAGFTRGHHFAPVD